MKVFLRSFLYYVDEIDSFNLVRGESETDVERVQHYAIRSPHWRCLGIAAHDPSSKRLLWKSSLAPPRLVFYGRIYMLILIDELNVDY